MTNDKLADEIAQPVEATPETDARVPICGTAGLTVPRVIWDEAMIAYQKTYGKDQRQYVRLLREGFYAEELDQLRPGWRPVAQRIADLERQLHLAQTENAGHIRIEDELKAELREAQAGNRIWRDRRDAALALVEKAESDLAQAQARGAELEKAFERVERELAYLLRT